MSAFKINKNESTDNEAQPQEVEFGGWGFLGGSGMPLKFGISEQLSGSSSEEKNSQSQKQNPSLFKGRASRRRPICPNCGSTDVIRRGKVKEKKGEIQRFFCKSCGHGFRETITCGSRHPEAVVERVFRLATGRSRFSEIADEIAGMGRKMVRSTVPHLLFRYVDFLNQFELAAEPDTMGSIWMIDEACEIVSLPTEGRKKCWVINIIDLGTRYLLVSRIFLKRDEDAVEHSLRLAIARAKREPLEIYCDAYVATLSAIRKILPNVLVRSMPKSEDYGFINEIEALHHFIRQRIPKTGFRTLFSVQTRLDVLRFFYNYFRPHTSLEGETPAKLAGFSYPSGGWCDFINYARRQVLRATLGGE
jgi:transposase-like protein